MCSHSEIPWKKSTGIIYSKNFGKKYVGYINATIDLQCSCSFLKSVYWNVTEINTCATKNRLMLRFKLMEQSVSK